jgi:hypothetical protein
MIKETIISELERIRSSTYVLILKTNVIDKEEYIKLTNKLYNQVNKLIKEINENSKIK